MSKHEIEVEGLPDGYEISEVELKTKHAWKENEIFAIDAVMHVKKKRPRRITFEETDCAGISDLDFTGGVKWRFCDGKYWREVKETEEPKLCLSVQECKELVWDCRITESVVYDKLIIFINNNKTS